MQNQESNLVYVVVLSHATPEWSQIPWIEFVTKKKLYFHHCGVNGWPKDPPTYLGFRYDGKLQSIHHVERYKIVPDISAHIAEIDGAKLKKLGWPNQLLYELGPAIEPPHEVKTGKIYPNGRVWAAIDLLLTCKTISDARAQTKERLNKEVK